MALRINQGIITAQSIMDINKNLRALQELQLQISSGKRILKVSDDPIGIGQALHIKQRISQTSQNQKNITDGKARLNASINALSNVEELLVQMQVMAQKTTSSISSIERSSVVVEINQFLDEALINANAKFQGKYLFGGQETLTAPYIATYDSDGNITGVSRNTLGIDDPIHHTTTEGVHLQINISGSAPFMPAGEGAVKDIFTTMIALRDTLKNNDISTITDLLSDLNEEYKNVLQNSSSAGAKIQRLDTTSTNNAQLKVNDQSDLSDIMDLDMTKALIDLNFQNSIFQASLQIGAKIIAPSLLDYI